MYTIPSILDIPYISMKEAHICATTSGMEIFVLVVVVVYSF